MQHILFLKIMHEMRQVDQVEDQMNYEKNIYIYMTY